MDSETGGGKHKIYWCWTSATIFFLTWLLQDRGQSPLTTWICYWKLKITSRDGRTASRKPKMWSKICDGHSDNPIIRLISLWKMLATRWWFEVTFRLIVFNPSFINPEKWDFASSDRSGMDPRFAWEIGANLIFYQNFIKTPWTWEHFHPQEGIAPPEYTNVLWQLILLITCHNILNHLNCKISKVGRHAFKRFIAKTI